MKKDEIKSDWQSAKNKINGDMNFQSDDNRKTTLERLANSYQRFSRFGLIFMLIGPLILWNAGIRSLWVLAGLIIMMGAASVTDYYLTRSIRAINPSTMQVTEVLERTMRCRKIHLLWVAIALPVIIFWIAATAYMMRADIYFIYGVCFGGLVGLAIGIRVLIKFLADYRELMQK